MTVKRLSRRVRSIGPIPVLLVALLFATACGADDTETPPSTATSPPPAATTVPTVPTATTVPTPVAMIDDNPVHMDSNAKYGGVLKKAGYADPGHFDLMQSRSLINSFKQMMLYNGILRYNPLDAGKTIVPDLALSWAVSDDGLVWTFPIREGVKFHDGTILTAEDIEASWSRIVDPPEGVTNPRTALYIPYGTSVKATEPLTVEFTFTSPPPLGYMLHAIAQEWHGIYPKSALEANNYDLKEAGLEVPGTGAFKFLEFKPGETWKNERFDDYWNEGLPYLDEVWVVTVGGGADSRSAALLAGNVDFAQSMSFDGYNRALEDPKFDGMPFASYSYYNIWFNMDREPFDDPNVRRAVWLALDRTAMHSITSQYQLGYIGGGGWTWEDQAFELPKAERDERLVYDRPAALAEAKRLMAEAGYEGGLEDLDFLQRNGGNPHFTAAAEFAQVELQKHLGITSTIRPAGSSVWFEDIENRNFDLVLGAISAPFADPSAYMNTWYGCGSIANNSNYCNEDFQAIMAQVDTERDFDKRYALVRQAADILDQDPPQVGYWYNRTLAAWGSYVKGITGKDGAVVHNMDRWDTIWIDK